MSTRIHSEGPQPLVGVQPTAHRTTPPPSRPFSALVDTGASAVVQGAEAAATRLPGGPVVVAAVRDSAMRADGGPAMAGGGAPGGSAMGAAPGVYGGNAPGTASSNNLENAISRQTQDSLYFLELQQRIQDETRSYQAVSNVMKARHESVKNAIGNLR